MLAPLRGWEQSVSIPDHYPVVIIPYPFYGFIVGLTNVLAAIVWCQVVYDWLLPVPVRCDSEVCTECLGRKSRYLEIQLITRRYDAQLVSVARSEEHTSELQ